MFERPFVEIDRVWMRYGGTGGTLALRDASLAVNRQEFVAVVGPSGCGKSTLMRLVTGLWPVSSGTVMVAGRPVDGPLSIAGMAFQNPTLLPWRSIMDNVMLPLEVVQPHAGRLRRDRATYEQQCLELLEVVGLKGFERKNPWQLSGGMQQRASLCRALIHQPELLMLDEPFASLDVFTREDLWGVMQNLWMARRPTVILVTHDLREAVFLADRILVMTARPGRIMVECDVDLPRPRTIDMTYTPAYQNLVQELRGYIDTARRGEETTDAA